jgi:MGT family glycosyltransferase
MGHLHPLLGIGRILMSDGHEVMGVSSTFLRERIEAIGAQFRSFLPDADLDTRDLSSIFPEFMANPPPPPLEMRRLALERGFIETMLPQYETIKQVMKDFPADIIIGDHTMCGVLPLLFGPRSERPPIVLLGTTCLIARRDDGAPCEVGIPMATNDQQRAECVAVAQTYDEAVFGPVCSRMNEYLGRIGIPPVKMNFFHGMVEQPDIYLQLTVPSFEFPRREPPPSVRFVGPLPITPNQAPVPSWADELDDGRKVVLVTQGTLTNADYGQLILPTLEALADQPDVLVMVTLGGKPVEALSAPLPKNVRVAAYLPFEWAMSKIDAFVTNGGYGSLNQALSFGVPVVTAGTIADRGDVGVRVAWSGVGINLATDTPTSDALRSAVRRVLDEPQFRQRAGLFADEARSIDTRSEVLRILNQLVAGWQKESGRDTLGRSAAAE